MGSVIFAISLWKEKFDGIGIKYWKTNPSPATYGKNLNLDSEGRAPRLVY